MPGSLRSLSPQSTYSRRSKSVAPSKQWNVDNREPNRHHCGSEFVKISLPLDDTHEPLSGRLSSERSPQTRHHPYNNTRSQTIPDKSSSSESSTNHSSQRHPHPYDRVARYYPYNTNPRPEVLSAHTLLCSVKLSDSLIADRPPPNVDEYPVAPVSPFQEGHFTILKCR